MHQLFVTEVYQSSIEFDLRSLKTEIYQIAKSDSRGQKWSEKHYPNGYTSYGSWDQLNKMSSTFERLQKKIDRHVARYVKKLDYDQSSGPLKMNSIWVNIMPRGSLHTSHIHPQSVISGTYYVDIPPKSSAIKFEDPRMAFFMNSPALRPEARQERMRFFSLQPQPGDLILFESWLRHEVPLNNSQRPRLSISFNYA